MSLFGKDAAGRIASRVLQTDHFDEEIEELFAFSVRVPLSTKAMVDELAENVGVSRNSMIVELIQAGIEDVLGRLPPEVSDEMREGAMGRM